MGANSDGKAGDSAGKYSNLKAGEMQAMKGDFNWNKMLKSSETAMTGIQDKNYAQGISGGAGVGAAIGGLFGPIGSGVGAVVGGISGGIATAAGKQKKPEVDPLEKEYKQVTVDTAKFNLQNAKNDKSRMTNIRNKFKYGY